MIAGLSLTKLLVVAAIAAAVVFLLLKPKIGEWLRAQINLLFTHPPEPASTPIEQIRAVAVDKPPTAKELQAVVAAHREAASPLPGTFTGGGTTPGTLPGAVDPIADLAARLEAVKAAPK